MTLPSDRIGDLGQRFEIRYRDGDNVEQVLGWSNKDPSWLIAIIECHPDWHSPRVIDRK